MKYIINQVDIPENELILNYNNRNSEVETVISFMEKNQKKLIGRVDQETVIFSPEDILYIEKVDDKTFAYTADRVIQLDMSLSSAEYVLGHRYYFRCSKSMIINIRKVTKLKSLPSNRIDATISSGEHIIISRTYASDFRRLLKGE